MDTGLVRHLWFLGFLCVGCASPAFLYNPQTGEYAECVPHLGSRRDARQPGSLRAGVHRPGIQACRQAEYDSPLHGPYAPVILTTRRTILLATE